MTPKKTSFPVNVAGGEHSFRTHKLAGSLPHDAVHCAYAHDCTHTGPAWEVVPLWVLTVIQCDLWEVFSQANKCGQKLMIPISAMLWIKFYNRSEDPAVEWRKELKMEDIQSYHEEAVRDSVQHSKIWNVLSIRIGVIKHRSTLMYSSSYTGCIEQASAKDCKADRWILTRENQGNLQLMSAHYGLQTEAHTISGPRQKLIQIVDQDKSWDKQWTKAEAHTSSEWRQKLIQVVKEDKSSY